MKHLFLIATLLTLGSLQFLSAQNFGRSNDPLMKLDSADRQVLKDQAINIFSALDQPVAEISKSTVTIGHPHNRLAFGIAVKSASFDDVVILTKWSEVADYRSRLFITTPDNKKVPAQISGVYPDHDLGLLSLPENAPAISPIDLTNQADVELGDFIALARHNGKAEGFGVISVKNRSLQEAKKGYLGVQMSFEKQPGSGVLLEAVIPNSAAALAGLIRGDELLSIDGEEISEPNQMRKILQNLSPGSKVNIRYKRANKVDSTIVILGSRADDKRLQRVSSQRMNHMERMGADLNYVRSNFPIVIQSDINIESEDVGSAAVNLDGEFVGIAIARASRIKTYIIPAATVQELLNTKPLSVEQALYGRR